jgi:hypothetical protein
MPAKYAAMTAQSRKGIDTRGSYAKGAAVKLLDTSA